MKLLGLACAGALALTSSLAFAGVFAPVPVMIDTENGLAFGDQLSARFSKNDQELIGCGVRYRDDGEGGVFVFAFCQATDADGNSLSCLTFSETLVEAVESISAYSFITFAADEEGTCISIGNSTQSVYLPDALGPVHYDDDDKDDDDDDDKDDD